MQLKATEHDIQKGILDLLAAERVFAFRLNTAVQAYDHGGKSRFFACHSLGKGCADICAVVDGAAPGGVYPDVQVLWIEVKTATGQQTEEQQSFQAFVEGWGHSYLLARSIDDLSAWLKVHR
jgi:hypothetical protein